MARIRDGFAWLIELASSEASRPLYLRGDEASGTIGWTHDHNEARQFTSEPAAKAFAATHIEGDVRVREHGWG